MLVHRRTARAHSATTMPGRRCQIGRRQADGLCPSLALPGADPRLQSHLKGGRRSSTTMARTRCAMVAPSVPSDWKRHPGRKRSGQGVPAGRGDAPHFTQMCCKPHQRCKVRAVRQPTVRHFKAIWKPSQLACVRPHLQFWHCLLQLLAGRQALTMTQSTTRRISLDNPPLDRPLALCM